MNLFTQVPMKKVPRNFFDLGHEVKMSGKFGYLYPILLKETMPGDTWRNTSIVQARFAPMLAPIMHRCNVKTDFFFVPMRLIAGQELWENFITGGQDGTLNPVLPFVTPNGITTPSSLRSTYMEKGSLWDYLGLPVNEEGVYDSLTQFSALPFRAYQQVYNDWFRDPNLDDEIDLDLEVEGDVSADFGAADTGIGNLRKRGWDRDMFTGALPWAQRGASVLMPLTLSGDTMVSAITGNPVPAAKNIVTDPLTAGAFGVSDLAFPIANYERAQFELDNATTTINDFRTALALQSWLENNARGGGRYIDQIQAHYGQRVPDYRLQRSEYLGGGRQAVQISQVLSTAEGASVPVGDMAGHGISVGKSNRFTYHCQEHGYILGIMSIVPTTAYLQGVEKLWSRTSRYDFAFPELAHMGEQEIKSREVFYSFNAANDAANAALFGYVPRYAEYKFSQDRVSGDFRDQLLFWHLSRKFTARPTLHESFLRINEDGVAGAGGADEEPLRRIFAVNNGYDYLWIQIFHNLTAKRPLPYFGVPRLIG